MTPPGRLVTVGRVGRPHGRDGSFWVADALAPSGGEDAIDPLEVGAEVAVAGRARRLERRGGTPARPLVRLEGLGSRSGAAALRGEALLVSEERAPLGRGEWLAEDLVGARIEGLGEVRRVLAGASCDLLEVGDEEILVPLVSDAIRRIDAGEGVIEVDRKFLGLPDRAEVADSDRATVADSDRATVADSDRGRSADPSDGPDAATPPEAR